MTAHAALDIYQHDSAAMLRFVLRGELAGDAVERLENWWVTASSTLGSRELVVDVSGVAAADPKGRDLLDRMRESGARLTAGQPPASLEFLQSLEIPVAAPGAHGSALYRLRRWLCGRGRDS